MAAPTLPDWAKMSTRQVTAAASLVVYVASLRNTPHLLPIIIAGDQS